MKCRHCGTLLSHTFLNLGFAPPSNAYLTTIDLLKPEIYFPLIIKVCDNCWLVQTEDYAESHSLFNSDYSYFSSTSSSWVAHAANYTNAIITKLSLNKESFVIEVAANDGYLLKNFVEANIPCLGIEPTASTAAAAEKLGVPIIQEFFGEELGQQLAVANKQADLIIGNNVYAHVPNINDFTRGMKAALKAGGTITLEFPHLLKLLNHSQFDTIYHEHFSYLSLYAASNIFKSSGLKIYDVEEIPTHGGSLRVYGCHIEDSRSICKSVQKTLKDESEAGLQTMDVYRNFQKKADSIKNEFLSFLLEQKKKGAKVAAYGAAAKGNTLLNYAGIKPDLIPFVCDAAQAKQNKFMPGSHIPILSPSALETNHIDYLIILPWNIATEVQEQFDWLRDRGTQFVTAVPTLLVT